MTTDTWTYSFTASGRLRITLTTTEGGASKSSTWLGKRAVKEMSLRGLSLKDMTLSRWISLKDMTYTR